MPQQAGAGSDEQVLPDPQSSLLRQGLVEMMEVVEKAEVVEEELLEEIGPFSIFIIFDFISQYIITN